MQTPKSRPASLDVPQKPSRGGRNLKTSASDSSSVSSPIPARKTPKGSPKVVDRRSPRSPATEKKNSRLSELESWMAQLQEELKKTKDELSSSETWKKRAQQEADEYKKQFAAMETKLEETHKQLKDLSDCEEAQIQELRKISHQLELEALQKQHSLDSTALSSALNEIQRLKLQLDIVVESEASQARRTESVHNEIHSLRLEHAKALGLVEKLKKQVVESRESEARALEELGSAQILLEIVKTMEETLRSEHADVMKVYNCLLVELEHSKNKKNSLEELVGLLQADAANCRVPLEGISENECDRSEKFKTELNDMKYEASRLKNALLDSERSYEDHCLHRTVQDLVDQAKSESDKRVAELEAKLEASRVEVEGLKTEIIKKENAIAVHCKNELNQKIEENKLAEREIELELELKKLECVLENLKTCLIDKEARLQNIAEENEKLKSEIMKQQIAKSKASDESFALAGSVKTAEQEASLKLAHLTDEADKSRAKASRVNEQLNAVQSANSEMESELRKLKVQSDQWRKAAEAAAALLSNGKYVERTGSLDYDTISGKLGSTYSDDVYDDSPKKKNSNVLKKISVLLMKGQK